MKLIWAVVRTDKVDAVARKMKDAGVSGATLYPVRGYGEQWRLYEPLVHGGHHKIEAIVEDDQVEKLLQTIRSVASTGREGDGILAVLDVSHFVHLKVATLSD